jgi:anti-anti-sigma factor
MSIQQLSDQLSFAPDGEPLLALHLVSHGPVVVVEVRGEVDMSNAHLLTELIEYVVQERPSRVVLDLAEVRFFCADGLRALLHARDTVTAAGGHLVLRAPSRTTWRVLTVTQTDRLFSVHRRPAAATG